MSDPRKPKVLRARTLSVLVVDANNFSRGLIAEILRGLNITNVNAARTEDQARTFLAEHPVDVVLLSWDAGDAIEGYAFCRALRRLSDERVRKLPVILITSGLTRETVIAGRDAGVDEFLAKPMSPAALKQRLEMVIETPRPFVDCSVFIGPCRRRKNPADYYGAKRRAGDRIDAPAAPMIDHDEEAAKTPIRLALASLRQTCAGLAAGRSELLATAMDQIKAAKLIAMDGKDNALLSSLAAFEAYVGIATPMGQLEDSVILTALGAVEQLAALPLTYTDARDSVAIALGKAIQKKLAA